MKKINIVEMLRNCLEGMELDCVMYDNIVFAGIQDGIYPIKIKIKNTEKYLYLTKYGCSSENENAKCVIFPKGKTTWEGFHRPFEDGDILATDDGSFIAIIKKNGGKYYCCCHKNGNYFITDYSGWFDRFATEEEKEKLFQTIKDNGYHWDEKNKTLEKLPIFKVGNKIRHKENKDDVFKIDDIDLDNNLYCCGRNYIQISYQDKYELIPDKFDINTLKPFDKVLVRDCNEDKWKIDFFSDYNDNGTYQCMTFTKNQCIPYEGNEHLRNTTNSCDDYFKTWEK